MRVHLYEFRSDKRKLTCSCGWERTLKTVDPKAAASVFHEHREESERAG